MLSKDVDDADSMDGVQKMPPYGITEPKDTYADGKPRENGTHCRM